MVNEKLNNKVIKDLELMSKKLKKRIATLDMLGTSSGNDVSHQIAILTSEYRMLKREIVDISTMTYVSDKRPV